MVFYEQRKKIMFRVIVAVIYTIVYNFICLYYLCMIQDNIFKHENKFEKTELNNFSGLGIPDILMSIISCHVFSKYPISTVVISCRSPIVPYYLSKVFVVVKTEEGGLDNILTVVKIKSIMLTYIPRNLCNCNSIQI